jgi:glycine reductase complex component B subunit gamma
MPEKIRVVHYINQFFAGLGGEEHADHPPERRAGPVGPGRALQQAWGDEAEIVATLVCGDNYFSRAPDAAADELLALAAEDGAQVLVAGPAFDSGRYGMACGKICVAAQERLGIPGLTGLLPENPAAEIYAPYIYIVPTGNTAATMRAAIAPLARLALKLARGEPLGRPAEEGYLSRGLRRNVFAEQTAARRAVQMLLKKVRGEPFETELRVPVYDRVPPAPALPDLAQAIVAVGTEGGTVPTGNPDRLEHVRATRWARYPIGGLSALPPGSYESAHGGYDARFANADPNRMVPVDSLRALEQQGVFAGLGGEMYVTVGCGMPIAKATEIGQSIAEEMKSKGIQAIIMTAT